ncbi:winged helix-turn-helix transcriptional regulator [Microbacterium sp. RD1]|uniref:winged helix-turn-helix transcriptional regulator n=1 Tax=Microbacterium sp. RD1 TaxID=3457313 RepID=UPI003FA560A7
MPLRSDWSAELCPIRRSLDVIGDPWALLIIRDLLQGPRRFDTLRQNLRASEAVLARRLRSMVDAGLLVRVDETADGRTRRGYAATPAAIELLPVLQQLAIWGERHTALPAGGGHMALRHESCGHETTSGQVCSACGELLEAEDMAWDRSWLGTRTPLEPRGALA